MMLQMRLMNHLRKASDGQWEVRIVVPADCRERIGKSNLTRRLGTASKSEANRMAPSIIDEFKAQIERARRPIPPPVSLSPHSAIAALGRWRDSEIARFRSQRFNSPRDRFPSEPDQIAAWLDRNGEQGAKRDRLRQKLSSGMLPREHDATILSVLADNGMEIEATHPAMEMLRSNFAQMLLAILDADEAAQFGDFGAIPVEVAPYNASGSHQKVSTTDLLDGYAAERKPPSATLARWKRVMAALAGHVGHDDATRITPDHIVAWKTKLLSQNLSAETVKNTYLAGVKTVFGWGVANRKITTNPASNISVAVPRKTKVREKGFTPDEATKILRAASIYSSTKATPLGVRARCWVPWLCAYTGARVGEIAQLRGCDVEKIQGHWVIRITPEAGTVKTREARLVPIHSHLIETGFVKMIEAAGKGPLFYEAGCKPTVVADRVGSWVRDECGITDQSVRPNHAWRHLWKTRARSAGIEADVRDAIQGHATRTEGEEYGEWAVKALAKAMAKFPRFEV
ncbi:MAG: site-specific integrase [Sphingomonadaceae bacterium]